MHSHDALQLLEAAKQAGKLSAAASANIRPWLTDTKYAEFAEDVVQHLSEEKFNELNKAFWKVLEFGTGGRRGEMYPIGTAVINRRTIGESAAGLAAYVKANTDSQSDLSCAISHDTRHHSPEFARLCAEIMAAAGFTVYFLEGFHSTPCLSFTVRYKQCSCGIMITASHNPPSDNGFKAYWSNGGQLVPPHDAGVIDQVMAVETIGQVNFETAVHQGKIILCQEEIDAAYVGAVKGQAFPGPREAKIIYSPLHGVGSSAVLPVLAGDGFSDVEEFGPQATPDGDFPNVPDHISNPENAAVFDSMIEHGRKIGADVALATDPDCDRIGLAAPTTLDPAGPWETFTGNQLAALLCDFVLSHRQAAGQLSANHFIVTTLVTTRLIERITQAYKAKFYGNLLVGFKWIANTIDQHDPNLFAFGAEESHGYLVGQYARDKDGPVAAMLAAEMVAETKAAGITVRERLENLFVRYGCHAEKTISIYKRGESGMEQMLAVMDRLREHPPEVLADMRVVGMRDYLKQITTDRSGNCKKLEGPIGNLLILDFQADGNYVAVRPSGTEPKIKFYLFGHHPPEDGADIASVRKNLDQRLSDLADDLVSYAEK
ncbi:MAG: phosphomannomutase [Planctomycetaceae bacterium]|nr:phosphomannomutase [Planctomycetaceae bacterium]|tara:strand:+ start:2514 stop:4319 length:1806 start_codon:yes stop_codon:yes gene_type:complete